MSHNQSLKIKIGKWLSDRKNDENDLIDFLIDECGVVIEEEEEVELSNSLEVVEEVPLCSDKWKSECKNPCSRKYIGDQKSEMWGETDEYSIHKYHWNLCDKCYKIEQGCPF